MVKNFSQDEKDYIDGKMYPKGLDSIADKQMVCECKEITKMRQRVPYIQCIDCGRGYNSIKDWENNRKKENDMKELTVKEAMIHMLNGGECRVNISGHILYNNNDCRFVWVDGSTHELSIANNYYIHETPLVLLPGVGKIAIHKKYRGIQLPILHNESGYCITDLVTYEHYNYQTIMELKKEWFIVE